jgi:N-acetyl-anhydromuramyl-L-alanine amidase AmpD
MLVAVLLVSTATALDAADRFHLVKRGDTLSGVARRYGVSVPALAERNGLKPSAWLLAGQKLAIPSSSSASSAPKPTLPAEVQRALDSVRVKSGRWKRIVIHHSGTSEGTVKGMNEYHLKVRHMENGLAYHFVIGNGHGMEDGEIYVGNRWKKQINGGHLASEAQNATSLGICLVGNFDLRSPTSRQMKSLVALVEALQTRCGLSDKAVMTHQQVHVMHTRCPGKKFPLKSLMAELAR